MSATQQQNPYAEIEARRVNEWKSALIANPELLEQARSLQQVRALDQAGTAAGTLPDRDARGKDAARRAILTWDEIPDVLQLPAQNVEWVLDGIIPKASITLIAGEPGSYKSWLALCLVRGVVGRNTDNAICINTDSRRGAIGINTDALRKDVGKSTDNPISISTDVRRGVVGINTDNAVRINTDTRAGTFLGRACAPMYALYLDRENPFSVVRERMALLGITSLGVSPRDGDRKNVVIQSGAKPCLPAGRDLLHPPQTEPSTSGRHHEARYWGGWLPDPAPCIGDIRLLHAARERKPLIIFDSLIRFHGADENSATEMAAAMQDLRALANAGATVILLHHRAKSETSRYRGSSDIAGGVDLAISVSRDRSAGIIKLDCFKSRFSEEFSIALRPELRERGDFAVVDTRDSTAGPEADPGPTVAEALWEAIRANPGQTQSELLAASGLSKGKVLPVLEELDGKLWRSERSKNNARRFFPTEMAVQSELDLET